MDGTLTMYFPSFVLWRTSGCLHCMSPCHYVLGPPAIVHSQLHNTNNAHHQSIGDSNSQQCQLTLPCGATNNNTCSKFKPQLCSVPSHPIPSCSSQPNGTMHARVCLGPPPITDAAPSSPSTSMSPPVAAPCPAPHAPCCGYWLLLACTAWCSSHGYFHCPGC